MVYLKTQVILILNKLLTFGCIILVNEETKICVQNA